VAREWSMANAIDRLEQQLQSAVSKSR
jgi:hypothetical protein